jgi:hypothetical protein
VSDEFRAYRDQLRSDLTRHNVEVKVQEDFKDLGVVTLDKLDIYISACDAVVHLVGGMTGATAKPTSTQAIRTKYPDIAERLPPLRELLERGDDISYTQWEAWLALYHGKRLFIAQADHAAPRGPNFAPTDASRASQHAHLDRLRSVERYPGCRFTNPDQLAKEIFSSILDLLADQLAKEKFSSILDLLAEGSGGPSNSAGLPAYLSSAVWKHAQRLLGNEPSKLKTLEYLNDRDSQLGPAIIRMARQSAWGRWFAAQQLVNGGVRITEQYLYQIAAGRVMEKITNGEIEVRGRRPDPEQLGFESIDRTHWRSSWLACVRDPAALWKIIIIPRGGVELDPEGTIVRADHPIAAKRTSLLNYDSLIVDAHQFEQVFPATDEIADRERRKLLCIARHRELDKDEIQRLS